MAESSKTGSQAFGDLLRQGRERLGMSRRDLAEAADLSYPYISQLETGYRQPSADAIRNLAGVLKISLDDIFAAMDQGRAADTGSAGPLARGSSAGGSFTAQRAESPTSQRHSLSRLAAEPEPMVLARMEAPATAAPRLDAEADPGTIDRIVYQVVGMLSTLPPEQRLDAVAQLQAKVVQSVIDDEIRRSR
jgi:transcriptional regulator with XRE-family HTH domain